jgi:hypothetical protein
MRALMRMERKVRIMGIERKAMIEVTMKAPLLH